MFSRKLTYKKIPLLLFLLAVVFFVMSMTGSNAGDDTEDAAAKTEKKVNQRIDILESHVAQVAETSPDTTFLMQIPDDMVIYRYVNDSLTSWINQFPIINDDISTRMMIQRLTNFRVRLTSPLTEARDEFSYINLGPKWYIIKEYDGDGGDKIIAGLEVKNTLIDDLRKTENGVNPKFSLPGIFSIQPINHSGGSAISVDGIPLFKVIRDTDSAMRFFDNSLLRWTALVLLGLAMILFLGIHRTIRTYICTCRTSVTH